VRADRGVHTEPERRVTGEGQLLAVAAAAAWLGVGFVMVGRGCFLSAWRASLGRALGWSAVCSTPVIPGVCMPCRTISDYEFGISFT
jgi:hypothetical protein